MVDLCGSYTRLQQEYKASNDCTLVVQKIERRTKLGHSHTWPFQPVCIYTVVNEARRKGFRWVNSQ